MVDTAFNKMMELNYKHAKAQYSAAVFLLNRAVVRNVKRDAFTNVMAFARVNHMQVGSGNILLPNSGDLSSNYLS